MLGRSTAAPLPVGGAVPSGMEKLEV
jgi:hypothetical protein